MTKAILQVDIEYAKALMVGDRSDAEVALALTRRGIEPEAAARLVDDLRNGRRVRPEMAAPEWVGGGGRRSSSRRKSGEQPERHATKPAERPRSAQKRSHRPRKDEPQSNAPVWLAGGIVACLFIAGVILYINHRHNPEKTSPQPVAANPSTLASKPPPQPRTTSPEMELQPDGLHLSGTLLTRDGAGSNVTRVLGAPTRTNQLSGTSRVIYAYDQHGILVYANNTAATDSIVLDFEGMGGTNGTASPFVGTLKIDNQAIKGDTDTRTLTSIKQLGLKDPGADGGIFGGQYNGLELIFAYLKTPQRLSLVEITLK